MSICRSILAALASSILLSVAARADVSDVAQAFVDICPSVLIQEISPRDLGMVPQVDGISPVITKELIANMPGVFWRSEATDVTLSLPLGRLVCSVGGEVDDPSTSLAAFEKWRVEHPNRLQLIKTQTLGQSGSRAGLLLELCLRDPVDLKDHRAVGEVNTRPQGWSLTLTLHRDEACEALR
ncbi:hypothetical protein SLH49_08535 [Cognatiyoonia sp. IB215446]|uniref:hypothetical protein n=1 Tax=Cognatiyoonia sp. IB215446 TaxID=3097355 RepID=UPI002A0E8FE7|nr:hypothetical protein [Cognatiyoonia sp. IB215446]MDX8348031.1 hypothetical protein [Cognatiyoonia sp. IB215446]